MTAAQKAAEALRALYNDCAEYITINQLFGSDGSSALENQVMRQAREALAALAAEQAEQHFTETVLAEAQARLAISHRDVQALMASSDKLEAENTVLGIELAESRAREARAREEEREACAKLADESAAEAERLRDKPDPLGRDDLARISRKSWRHTAQGIAAAIRTRGEA